MQSDLYTQYQKELVAKLQKELGVKNPMQIPKVEKVVINVGMGSYLQKLGTKDFSFVEENIIRITGRKPVLRKAKLSVSNFKLREGMPVGLSVTLRDQAAYNFLYKLIHVAFPRVRDFRGTKTDIFDENGNMSIGITDHTVFPEGIVPEDARKTFGLQITVTTNTSDSNRAKALIKSFGFPFKK